MQALIGEKREQSQKFLENGARIPVTVINVEGNRVIAHRTMEKNNYLALQLGFGITKKPTKAVAGHAKGAKQDKAPKFLREIRITDDSILPAVGDLLNPSDVFKPGDIINVTGVSKGKGYAGVVKRHNFKGGPKTHGQSDRHRAPGAIGQGTTPGRVYKGKRMAGRMGTENVTIENLLVVEVNDKSLLVKGLVPGVTKGMLVIKKIGEHKKFIPLYKEPSEEEVSEVQEVVQTEEPSAVAEAKADKEAAEQKTEEAPVEHQTAEKEKLKAESLDTGSNEPSSEEPTGEEAAVEAKTNEDEQSSESVTTVSVADAKSSSPASQSSSEASEPKEEDGSK